MYYVYIVRCNDGTLYTGITNNIEKRLYAHNNLKSGARYTRTRRPVKLVYQEIYNSKSDAMSREYSIKQLSRRDKERLIK